MASAFTARLGKGPNFSHPRGTRHDQLSPRSSSVSLSSSSDEDDVHPSPLPRRSLTPERRNLTPPATRVRTGRVVTQAAFIVEELSDFGDSDHDRLDIVRPHAIEYAESDRSRSRSRNPPEIDQNIMYNLRDLSCGDSDETDMDEAEYQEFLIKRREAKRRKRMTSGSIGKRTISESIGSDTDREDLKPFPFLSTDEAGSSARRLRRRLGHGDRRSLQFQDPPPPRIDELDEPDSSEDEILISETLARELPYYEYVSMEVDSPEPC
ncbi:hypothetical protein B0H67DRAFT_641869 [Lasiosphaeris hirsuta]|uniref:Uncharacterized protein n=1 Tax=Lasiosphaeris hirsuta TaxID=260670 RepID=A0AA40E2E2_9PEZI|nr:hypothetical protein B0H67DRAFT_641869 [Lasiosphaeris hirsuta]